MRSKKEQSTEKKIIQAIKELGLDGTNGKSGKVLAAAELMVADKEILATQDYANNVSIVRLGYNDHGPVHMRTVACNVITMMGFLRQAGIKTSLEKEEVGNFEDSLIASMFAGMLHDLGMSISRQDHDIHSAYMALPILDRILSKIYAGDLNKRIMVRCLALEGIYGHMGSRAIHSLEAGIVQVADGCDMTKGRARIPMALGHNPKGGHIHQYSANSIEDVKLSKGAESLIRIDVFMSSEVGYFQVEEVLLHKIASSTAKPHIELYAKMEGREQKRYL